MHIIAAKAVALGEALKPEFKDYQGRIVKNAQALAASLTASGFDLVSGGTDNHLMPVSYTHLDVYKRQYKQYEPAHGNMRRRKCNAACH